MFMKLFVGDDIHCDSGGAKAIGMKTNLFFGIKDYKEEDLVFQPNYVVSSIEETNSVVDDLEAQVKKR